MGKTWAKRPLRETVRTADAAYRAGLSGCWSRRIEDEHRLVYRMEGATLVILACRYHYR